MMMMMIPEVFACPISLDLLSDPVTLLTTAQTYDRPNIHRWLAAGHRTCPVTMQPLPHNAERLLVPNRTLKHLIDRWLLTGRSLSVSDLALPALRDNLQLRLNTVDTLRILRSLSPAGFCPLLLRLLLSQPPTPCDHDQHAHAAAVLELAVDCLVASPSTHELASALRGALQEKKSNVSSFALLLRQGSLKVKTGLCRIIQIVAAAKAVMLLGRAEPVMGALAGLVQGNGCSNAAASDAALRAMSSLCSSDQATREAAVVAGAVDALISYISSGSGSGSGRKCLSLALETLELVLINVEAGRQAMYTHPAATSALVKMVFRVPYYQGGSEHAVGLLLVACRESPAVRVDAINAGMLTQLLLLLQSQCSPKAKADARALLKLLRAMWARD